jgi:hypothetical protein
VADTKLTKEETKLPEGITKGYARWVIDEWQNVVPSNTLTATELDALDQEEAA